MPIKDVYGAWGGGPTPRSTPVAEPLAKLNSTETPLGVGEVFLGEFEATPHTDVCVSCITDQDGILYFDFGINSDTGVSTTFPTSGFTVKAGVHEFHTAIKGPRYFRVRFENTSGFAQTYLRIGTYYGTFRFPSAPLRQTLGNDADALVVRAIPGDIDMSLGRLGGVGLRFKFGSRSNLGSGITSATPSTWVDVWSYKRLRRAHVEGNFTIHFACTDTGWTGKDISIEYIDTGDGAFATATVTTDTGNAADVVNTGITAQECFRGYVTADTGPAGDVIFAKTSNFGVDGVPNDSGDVLFDIKQYDNQSQLLAFRVRSTHQAIITKVRLAIARDGGLAGSAIAVLQTSNSSIGQHAWRTRRTFQITTSAPVDEEMSIVLEPGTDVRVRVRDVSDVSTNISGDIQYTVVEN